MKTFEITASAADLGITLFWSRGRARAREQYVDRLTRAQLGDPRDEQRTLKAEARLARTQERFSRNVRRKA